MVWFVVDDVLPFHERVVRAGNAAMGLWVRAGAWCTGQLTDGFVPTEVARTMGSAAEIRRLVTSGLWEVHEKDDVQGYLFHAWGADGTGTKRQLTKAEVEEKRRKEREKKRAQREKASHGDDGRFTPAASPAMSPGDTLGDGPGESHRSPSLPYPSPSSLRSEGGAPHVDNPGDDPEPPTRCLQHAYDPAPPPCGRCKDWRLEHERWEIRNLAAEHRATARPPAWDVRTHCEHGQIRGACEVCAYEASRDGTVIVGPWGGAPCDVDAARSPART